MSCTVYILQSEKSGRYYIGQTENIQKRIDRHNSDRVSATKGRGPWFLVYETQFKTRTEAVTEERHIKKQKSRLYLEKLIAGWRSGISGVS